VGLDSLLVTAAAVALSAALTLAVLRRARANGLFDVPNERSSHAVPTPTGGGLGIAVTATAGFLVLAFLGETDWQLFAAAAGGVAVAAAGFVDDRRRLSARSRLIVQGLAAIWALAWLGGLHALRLGETVLTLPVLGYGLGVLGIVWTINLFNFMDGIDGIAAAQAIFMTGAAAFLGAVSGFSPSEIPAELLLAAACAGFAIWNWPPARIFMGDVGSGFIGYLLAILALATARTSAVALAIWLTLGGVFFVDATVTLVRRFLRGERVHEPHRSHAYQWLARRWGSHRRVTLVMTLINVGWLLPCAWLEQAHPRRAALITALALIPLVVVALWAGAGRREAATVAAPGRGTRDARQT
jgi:Fuc2NAc and GlcNAc transferase